MVKVRQQHLSECDPNNIESAPLSEFLSFLVDTTEQVLLSLNEVVQIVAAASAKFERELRNAWELESGAKVEEERIELDMEKIPKQLDKWNVSDKAGYSQRSDVIISNKPNSNTGYPSFVEEVVRMSARSELFTLGCSYRLLAAVCEVGNAVPGEVGVKTVRGRARGRGEAEEEERKTVATEWCKQCGDARKLCSGMHMYQRIRKHPIKYEMYSFSQTYCKYGWRCVRLPRAQSPALQRSRGRELVKKNRRNLLRGENWMGL